MRNNDSEWAARSRQWIQLLLNSRSNATSDLPATPLGASLGVTFGARMASMGVQPFDPDEIEQIALDYERRRRERRISLVPDISIGEKDPGEWAERAQVAATDAASGLASLSVMSDSDDPSVRQVAFEGFAFVGEQFRPASATSQLVAHPIFRRGRAVDDALGELRQVIRPPRAPRRILSRAWTFLGLCMTVAVVAYLISGQYFVAGVLLAMRQLLTTFLGGEGSLPFEWSRSHADRDVVFRCVATHMADAIMIGGIAIAGSMRGQLLVVALAIVALIAMLSATLLRVSALQVGVQITRLNMERVVRVWPATGALLVAPLLAHSVQPNLLMVAASGCLVYGAGEGLRSLIRISHDLRGKNRILSLANYDCEVETGRMSVTNSTRRVGEINTEKHPERPNPQAA